MTRLPRSAEEAIYEAERHNAWLRKRFPGMVDWLSQSYAGDLVFFKYVFVLEFRSLSQSLLPLVYLHPG